MKAWIKILFNASLFCICVCTAFAAISEELVWTALVSTDLNNDSHVEYEDQVIQYDYNTGFTHSFPVFEEKLSKLIMIDGNINGHSIIAAENCETDEWILYEWNNGCIGKWLASFPQSVRNNESVDIITDILAWRDGWTYLGISRYAVEDGMFFEHRFVRVKENRYELLGIQEIDDSIGSFYRAAISKRGTIAYWNQIGDVYGVCVVQPVDGDANTAFIPIFESGNRLRSYDNEEYYIPALPIIWKNERTILCFAVRTLEEESISYNDAIKVDIISQSAAPYLTTGGDQLSIPNLVLGAGSVLMNDEIMIVSAYHNQSPYWIDFEGTPLADAFFKISLETGKVELLCASFEGSFYNTDSIGILMKE